MPRRPLTTPVVVEPAMPSLSIAWSIIIGSLFISFSILLSGGVLHLPAKYGPALTVTPTAAPVAVASPVPAATPADAGPVSVGLGNDPMLGSASAPVTMIEFSDYECPFCKRYFDDTYSVLKTNYIDTGKLREVYRNFPLTFHQNAHKEAEAADCIREQGGDSMYFKYHDIMFQTTTSNGTGLSLTQLPTLATNIGADGAALQTCLDSGKYVSQVDTDISDGTKAGVNATPTFFIGKLSSDNTLSGTRMVASKDYPDNVFEIYSASNQLVGYKVAGALPTAAFQTEIDNLLK